MDITLTPGELATLVSLVEGAESVEDVFHRLLKPFVCNYAESSLQKIADIYRGLSPDLQVTAMQAVLKWKAINDTLNTPQT